MTAKFLAVRVVSLAMMLSCATAGAQHVTPTTGIELPVLGKIKARSAREIASSSWSIGGETLDRDFAVYEHYKQHLGPLGAKGLRVQAGWAKCEKQPGVYNWEWLDAIVNDAVAQGVRPWLEFGYGNRIYEGGGDTGLGGGFPSSPEALAAWDRWARALVMRYRDRVHEWEIWNEPDINKTSTATVGAYVDLYIRTATVVRELQPQSRIWGLGLAGNIDYADKFLAGLRERGKLDLVDAITIHGYPRNPDDTTNVDKLREVIARYGRPIQVRQGETGAPSRYQENFALSKVSWTETMQAKWDVRRLLAHHAKDVPMNLFTMSDMHYTQYQGGPEGVLRMNYKGLLATNPDQTIAYVKPAYYGAQTVFAIFDDSVTRIAKYPFVSTALRALAVAGYQDRAGRQIATVWFNDAPPSDANGVTHADLTLRAGRFAQPVLVDVRTSTVYELPKEKWTAGTDGVTFRGIPVYDSPMLIAEAAALPLAPGSP